MAFKKAVKRDAKLERTERHKRYYAKHGDAIKAKQAEWYQLNREKALAARRKYREANKETTAAAKHAYYLDNKERHIAKCRERKLRRLYGLEPGQYEQLLQSQLGRCAICRAPNNGAKANFHIDHCHTSGRVRGLLCTKCNTGIGLLGTRQVLTAAARYIGKGQKPDGV